MLTRAAAVVLVCAAGLAAQDAQYGVSVPVTLSAGVLDTHRFTFADPHANPAAAGYRAMFYPTIRLGSHWFLYAALQVRRVPYFYYDAYLPETSAAFDPIQAYAGYSLHSGSSSMVFKAGQLTTAFGSFPVRYDDVENPLLDQPLSYVTEVPLRSDQLSCGTNDLLRQHYGSVAASCGGAAGRGPGLQPVSLYGVLGAEAEISSHRFDGRVQLANSSPADPLGFTVRRRYVQWAAGGGYTIRQGFRVGVSGFRGPYLQSGVGTYLPSGTTVRDFPATGIGIDGQWARGRWSLNGEWQRIDFAAPNFVVAPKVTAAYLETKLRVTPRLYLAGRAGNLLSSPVTDTKGVTAGAFAHSLKGYEMGIGAWLNRYALLKVSYSWLDSGGNPVTRQNVLGMQLVTTFRQAEWAWR